MLGGFAQLLPIVLIIAVFYVLLIRPQQKRQRQLQETIASLKIGDRVITNGGIIGVITTVQGHQFPDSQRRQVDPRNRPPADRRHRRGRKTGELSIKPLRRYLSAMKKKNLLTRNHHRGCYDRRSLSGNRPARRPTFEDFTWSGIKASLASNIHLGLDLRAARIS